VRCVMGKEVGEREGARAHRRWRNRAETLIGLRTPSTDFVGLRRNSRERRKKGERGVAGLLIGRLGLGEKLGFGSGAIDGWNASCRGGTPGWRLKRALTSGPHSSAMPEGGGCTDSARGRCWAEVEMGSRPNSSPSAFHLLFILFPFSEFWFIPNLLQICFKSIQTNF
jgi:hypothetical protein